MLKQYDKRSAINGSVYQAEGGTFDILWNVSFYHTDFIQLLYVENFTDCMNECLNWADVTPCVGVQWQAATSGPEGGALCYLLWTMEGPGSLDTTKDSARLRNPVEISPPVCHLILL